MVIVTNYAAFINYQSNENEELSLCVSTYYGNFFEGTLSIFRSNATNSHFVQTEARQAEFVFPL